jgi:hypothetical protein
MPEESTAGTGDRHEIEARREARRREARWWKGGLIAALVFLGLATLYNGIAFRRLIRAQQRLVLSGQRYRPGFGPMGPPYGQGFGGQPYPPFPGSPPYYGGPGWGWHRWQHHGQPHDEGQGGPSAPGGQSTPG